MSHNIGNLQFLLITKTFFYYFTNDRKKIGWYNVIQQIRYVSPKKKMQKRQMNNENKKDQRK